MTRDLRDRTLRLRRVLLLGGSALAAAALGAALVAPQVAAASESAADATAVSRLASPVPAAHPTRSVRSAAQHAKEHRSKAWRKHHARVLAAAAGRAGRLLLPPARTGQQTTALSASLYGIYGGPFDIDPYGQPQRAYRTAQAGSDARTVRLIGRIADRSSASWFGHLGVESVEAGVRQRVVHAAKQGAVAVLVAYNIPYRDCGLHAAGTVTSGADYRSWIDGFVAGLGTHRALIVVEPDALSRTTCLSSGQLRERLALVRYAVDAFAAQGSWTYIDAGHSKWRTPAEIASRLKAAGIDEATGFSLNVSNFRPDDELIGYGTTVSGLVGGKHFVIDTSRNGIAPSDETWCNPANKGLGLAPTGRTGQRSVDAYLWIKTPGGSDGPCNGGPSAGAWFQDYALKLSERAALSTPSAARPAAARRG